MTWGTTINGVTKTQQEIIKAMLSKKCWTTEQIAKRFDIVEQVAGGHLRSLRAAGIVDFQRRGNVASWSVNQEGLTGFLMFHESRSWDKGKGPRFPRNEKCQGTSENVLRRRDAIAEVISSGDGMRQAAIRKRVPGLTDADLVALVAEGRIQKEGGLGSWNTYYGAQAVAAE